MTLEEYFFFIDNYKEYRDFNTLGLYRSIVENNKLGLEEKITVREHAHNKFKKTFEFLQLKDPDVFVEVTTLGMELTKADKAKIWEDVKKINKKFYPIKKSGTEILEHILNIFVRLRTVYYKD